MSWYVAYPLVGILFGGFMAITEAKERGRMTIRDLVCDFFFGAICWPVLIVVAVCMFLCDVGNKEIWKRK